MNEEQVVRQYGPRVSAYVRALDYYLPGGEFEDLEQEALIGLLAACRTWRGQIPFWAYARVLIRRRLATVIRLAKAEKHEILSYSSRHLTNELGETLPVVEVLEDPRAELVELVELREHLRALVAEAARLSPLERRSVFGLAAGYSYAEIEGCETGRRARKVDNAIQRGREKLRRAA